ncbi:MAG: hypothetical protein EHM28_08730 [Spirochaetaceae bacterium]|nr:MAG: hypothetical protein EHM28_08730 [Spirochaetaceae bacterium]
MKSALMYFQIMRNSMRTAKAWKAAVVFQLILRGVMLFATVSVWHALYESSGSSSPGAMVVTDSGNAVTLEDTVTYMVTASVLHLMVFTGVIRILHQRIVTGDIALDLLKPASTMLNYFFQTAGESIVRVMTQALPFTALCLLAFHVKIPGLQNILLFFASTALAMMLNFLIYYTFGLAGFWHLSVNHVDFFLRNLLGFFSGSIIPLWFFPGFLSRAAGFLPFKYIYHVPASIFLGTFDAGETAFSFAIQGLWIVLLLLLQKLAWHFGTRKLVIQGG